MVVSTPPTIALSIALAVGVGVACPQAMIAQTSDGMTLESQRRGAATLARAMEAMGLSEFTGDVSLKMRVNIHPFSVGQGARPGAPSQSNNAAAGIFTYTSDLRGTGGVFEQFAADTSTKPQLRLVAGEGDPFAVNYAAKTVQPVDMATVAPFLLVFPSVAAALTEAWENPGTVRWLGEDNIGETRVDLVSYVDGEGRQITLHLDGTTGDVQRSEFLDSHPQFGDHIVTVDYGDYRGVHGLRVPHAVEVRTAGVTFATSEVESVTLGEPLDPAMLEVPKEMEWSDVPLGGAAPTADLQVSDLGNGAYLIPGASASYNVMFVDLGSSVFVLEAPVNAQVSEAVMHKIKETLPGKPIEYVVMSHFHFDHSGGLVPYLESHATVVASKGNGEFIKELARAPRTLAGHEGPIDDPQLEPVGGHREFGQTHRVELYEVGPNPHVDEILVAYLPESKLLFVADLYSYSGQVTPASAMTLAFADRLEELELEIETIIPVHGQQASAADFWESVRLGREQ